MYYYRRLPKFEYLSPATVEEASALLYRYKGEARILAGGTIVLHRMKERIGVRPYVIGIKGIRSLRHIDVDTTAGLKVGSMVGLQEMADSTAAKTAVPLLALVCGRLGTPQIRNMGTIGGNVACMLATAETVPALIALSAEVGIATAAGEKTVSVEDLYGELKDGDFITEIRVPQLPYGTAWGYRKFAVRERLDYATVGVAVVMTLDGATCTGIRIGLGGVTLRTMRARAAEEVMRGRAINGALIDETAGIAADGATLHGDLMFPVEYKKKVLRAMVRRAIADACGEATT